MFDSVFLWQIGEI